MIVDFHRRNHPLGLLAHFDGAFLGEFQQLIPILTALSRIRLLCSLFL